LTSQAEEGGKAWIEPMVRQLARPAFQLAMGLVRDREAAEDIVQEAFLRAMQNRRTPHIAEEFRLWLYRVIVNLVRDHQRRRARERRPTLWVTPSTDPAIEAERLIGDQRLAEAIQRLTQREREAIQLRFGEDASYGDTARIMGTRESTARVLVHRALDKLRASLSRQELEEGWRIST